MKPTNDVEVDARQLHPGVVFFQDKATRYTVAVEAETGRIIGSHTPDTAAGVWREVFAYQRARREVR